MTQTQSFLTTLHKVDRGETNVITLPQGQVIELVVGDLIAKYRHNAKRGNQEWASAFEKTLSYYLDEQEMQQLRDHINVS